MPISTIYEPKIKLVSCTSNIEEVVALAAGICYSPKEVDDLINDLSPAKVQALINKLSSMGHESPFEHASFTFAISDISRACSHQLVRHRIASYSQRSQRYVDETGFDYIIPPEIECNTFAKRAYVDHMAKLDGEYDDLRLLLLVGMILQFKGESENKLWGTTTLERLRVSKQFHEEYPKTWHEFYKKACEDARYILPNACATQLICTMNVRSLWNFFSLRCCNRAQWEIRRVADKMLDICRKSAPNLFRYAGPNCVKGKCPEGEYSCGESAAMKEKYKMKG